MRSKIWPFVPNAVNLKGLGNVAEFKLLQAQVEKQMPLDSTMSSQNHCNFDVRAETTQSAIPTDRCLTEFELLNELLRDEAISEKSKKMASHRIVLQGKG